MQKTYNKWFLSKVRQANRDYNMVATGDRIGVGVSGGKDSMALLFILNLLKKYSHLDFNFHAIALDLGQGQDFSPLIDYCQREQISLHVEATQIGEIVFQRRQEPNPCSLCAKLRRGALHRVALKIKCNKVALGHHLDDAVETLLMNIIFTGKLGTFSPSTFLDRTGLTLIRPMIYLPEAITESLVKNKQLPVISNPCPVSGHTKREEIRELVSLLADNYPDIREKFLTALQNIDFNNLWKQRRPDRFGEAIQKLIGVPKNPSNPFYDHNEPKCGADHEPQSPYPPEG